MVQNVLKAWSNVSPTKFKRCLNKKVVIPEKMRLTLILVGCLDQNIFCPRKMEREFMTDSCMEMQLKNPDI